MSYPKRTVTKDTVTGFHVMVYPNDLLQIHARDSLEAVSLGKTRPSCLDSDQHAQFCDWVSISETKRCWAWRVAPEFKQPLLEALGDTNFRPSTDPTLLVLAYAHVSVFPEARFADFDPTNLEHPEMDSNE
ncbi:unnamed protein product [Tilletia laevis]|uniref:Uncharacterized protein n=2 Tax=Tilletia TaxID=13289 RepID=A0A177TUV2_9BASI|nr:hypothetical protein CF335_g7285 [Tilletia laevis]KAE8245669.1 hypothetical protein A4X03_0g7454 [Tilletia caries]CAD6936553.1 unnamed protein product [Tilletia controversa]KAE8196130.1 hypothetical protein CF336_g2765 [Tilletia laevis]CAD6902035.1 unnamed protein product [Tilletia laevis]